MMCLQEVINDKSSAMRNLFNTTGKVKNNRRKQQQEIHFFISWAYSPRIQKTALNQKCCKCCYRFPKASQKYSYSYACRCRICHLLHTFPQNHPGKNVLANPAGIPLLHLLLLALREDPCSTKQPFTIDINQFAPNIY